MKILSIKHILTLLVFAIALIAIPKPGYAAWQGHDYYINGSICQAYYGENRSDIQNTQYGAWNYNLNSPVWVTCPVTTEYLNSKGSINYYVALKHNGFPNNRRTTCYINAVRWNGNTTTLSNFWDGGADNSTFLNLGSLDTGAGLFASATITCFLTSDGFIMGVNAVD